VIAKASFQRLAADLVTVEAEIPVAYNPTEVTLSKSVQLAEVGIPGLDAPILQFVRGQTETLNLELFFDTTDAGTAGDQVVPVTEQTDRFYQLVKINKHLHAPPVCRFVMGTGFPGSKVDDHWTTQKRDRFTCLVESVQQRFTLFSPDGVPLRAQLTVTLKEFKTLDEQITQIDFQSPDFTKTHVVARGETLNAIAHRTFGDSERWREIADRNGIDDPLAVRPGTILTLPPLRARPAPTGR
jgi:nucleoid-associated protein YgaU